MHKFHFYWSKFSKLFNILLLIINEDFTERWSVVNATKHKTLKYFGFLRDRTKLIQGEEGNRKRQDSLIFLGEQDFFFLVTPNLYVGSLPM